MRPLMGEGGQLRIGELSYRVGISTDVLRVWEKRYGVLRPTRSEKGYRLYSERDEWRVRLLQQKLWSGLSTAEAAREVLRMDGAGDAEESPVETPFELSAQLGAALEAFDDEGAHELVDRLLGLHGLERAIRDALLPYLHDLGERWSRQEVTVAQEHFASRFIEARLLALARGWNKGPGHRAVLACPPGEQHTLPLLCFGLALRARGWRNVYLGADTPPSTAHMAADTIDADVVVMSAVSPDKFDAISAELKALARGRRLVLGGAGATPEVAVALEVTCLHGDPIAAAESLSRQLVAT